MNSLEKEQLLKDIEEVRRWILSGKEFHVCVAASDTHSGHAIREMVKMHIGSCYTMETFLAAQWKCYVGDIRHQVVKSYRLCMLNNMRKWVVGGVYK